MGIILLSDKEKSLFTLRTLKQDFEYILEKMCKKISHSIDHTAGICFPCEGDFWDDDYCDSGIYLGYPIDGINSIENNIDTKLFRECLHTVANEYLIEFPEKEETIHEYLDIIMKFRFDYKKEILEKNLFHSYFTRGEKYNLFVEYIHSMNEGSFIKLLEYISKKLCCGDKKGDCIYYSNSFDVDDERYFDSGVLIIKNGEELHMPSDVFKEYIEVAIFVFLEYFEGDDFDRNLVKERAKKIKDMSF